MGLLQCYKEIKTTPEAALSDSQPSQLTSGNSACFLAHWAMSHEGLGFCLLCSTSYFVSLIKCKPQSETLGAAASGTDGVVIDTHRIPKLSFTWHGMRPKQVRPL